MKTKFRILFLSLFLVFSMHSFAQCASDTNALFITQNTTWSSNQTQTKDVFINSGVTLTITGTIEMYDHGNIFIDRGARLIIDGGTITRASCATAWGGIQVYGNSNQPQTSTLQGTLSLQNNATLSYAHTAISNSAYKCGFIWDKMGGIISAVQSHFYNNARDVQFGAYSYTAAGNTLDYQGNFTLCTFEKDRLFPLDYSMANITLWGVYGVNFRACEFIYSDTSAYTNKFSTGIEALNATFTITDNNQTPSKFTNYERSVLAVNAQRADKIITIENSEFYPRGIGVAMLACSNFEISHNYFETKGNFRTIPDPNPNSNNQQPNSLIFVRSVIADACSDFEIHDNDFYGDPTNHNNVNFIGVTNCYQGVNSIYKNKMANTFIHVAAIDAYGKNRSANGTEGVYMQCNEFVNNVEDIRAWAHTSLHQPATTRGIPEFQGSWDAGNPDDKDLANNLFSLTAITQSPWPITKIQDMMVVENLPNYSTNNVLYTHADNITAFTPMPNADPTIEYGNMNLRTIQGRSVVYEDACPTPPLAGLVNISAQQNQLSDLDDEFATINTTINEHLDEGHTEILEGEILGSLPDDYNTLYGRLMSIAPYVSVHNLVNLISMQDFPQGLLNQVLVANPQGYRSAAVKEALWLREEPLSDLDWATLEEATEVFTTYDDLRAERSRLNVARAKLARNIIRANAFEADESFDLEDFLLNRETPATHYALIDIYMKTDRLAEAGALLDDIALLPNQNEAGLEDWAQQKSYYELVLAARNSGRSLCALNSAEKDELLGFYLNGASIAATKALGLLILNEPDEYSYMGFVSPNTESSGKTSNAPGTKSVRMLEQDNWQLFPNPAKDYVILRWTEAAILAYAQKLEIRVYNSAGQCIHQTSVNDNDHTHTLHTTHWEGGLYTVQLIRNNQQVLLKKLIVQH
jgi:hypothetical protein